MSDQATPNHLAPWTLLGKTPEGTCEQCATVHEPSHPHNAQSLAYQYKFFDQHGRWPNWKDAMAHCTFEVQRLWREALIDKGVDVESGKVNPTL